MTRETKYARFPSERYKIYGTEVGETTRFVTPPASQSNPLRGRNQSPIRKIGGSAAFFSHFTRQVYAQSACAQSGVRRVQKGNHDPARPLGWSGHGAPFPKISPALAVGTRLKPARNGRWVASAALLCFQLPTGGREACNSRGESASRLRNVGLKGSKMTHEPSRADAAYSVLMGG